MILLDTDTVTHLSYGNERVRRRIVDLDAEKLAVTLITRHEILRGRIDNLLTVANEDELRKAADRLHKSEDLLSSFEVVSLNEDAINHFGKLRKQKKLKRMGRADMLNACIALAHDAFLITRNTKDYEDVPGLQLDNWVD